MEKHRCKLCYRRFVNGRALGGHMRSHMLNLYVPPKTEQPIDQLGEETESASPSSSEEEEEDKGLLSYGLRENPKKSIRLVDPEFSFTVDAVAAASSSVVLQDRESETESSKNMILGRRSKRIRKSGISEQQFHDQNEYLAELKKPKLNNNNKFSNKATEFSSLEPEPVSSISDTTPEEDVAYCLIMLSRDKWMTEKNEPQGEEEEEGDHQHSDDDSDHQEIIKVSKSTTRARAKYRCETCNRVFRSYQALGGHRASHKKIKLVNTQEQFVAETENNAGTSTMAEEKIHECPVCYRVFSSGQALGGHKRSHVIGSSVAAAANTSTSTSTAKPFTKHGETLIDLNLPAPIDDDEFSQIELSAVSDAEFVHHMKR